jgi:hypothetical protein
MTAQRGLEQGLRDWMREQESAPAYLAEVFDVTARTPQRGPSIVTRITDGLLDRRPATNARAMRVALVGLLLAALLGTLLVVGAILFDRLNQPTVIVQPSPPVTTPPPLVARTDAEIRDIILAAYRDMPQLPPLVLTAVVDGSEKRRVSVSEAGAVRVEHYDTVDAAEPTEYEIFSGESIGHLLPIDGEPHWYGGGGISEDARVFVYAALSEPGYADLQLCPSATTQDADIGENRWSYVGLETVLGRPVDHVACEGGHLWIDTETALVLRSRGPTKGLDGRPTGETSEIEVVDLAFTIPPEDLFALEAPPGVPTATDEQHERGECFLDGRCLEVPRSISYPPPADAPAPELTANQLARRAIEGAGPDVAYLARATSDNTGMNQLPNESLAVFDGADRARSEQTFQVGSIYESTTVSIIRDGVRYSSEPQPDGSTNWSEMELYPGEPIDPWPLQARNVACEGGWTLAGTDLVADRVADHIVCSADDRTELWIDRDLTVLLRIHTPDRLTDGVEIQEVAELTVGPVDLSPWFDVPDLG